MGADGSCFRRRFLKSALLHLCSNVQVFHGSCHGIGRMDAVTEDALLQRLPYPPALAAAVLGVDAGALALPVVACLAVLGVAVAVGAEVA